MPAKCELCGQEMSLARTGEAERLRAALRGVRAFLRKSEWGNYDYMDGTKIYADMDDVLASIADALGEDK